MNGNNIIMGLQECQSCRRLKPDTSTDVFVSVQNIESNGQRVCSCPDTYAVCKTALDNRKIELINLINTLMPSEEELQDLIRRTEELSVNSRSFQRSSRNQDSSKSSCTIL